MKRYDRRIFLQERADGVALNALAFAVDQAHFVNAGLSTLFKIFLDDAGYFLGLKRMQVEMVLDGNNNRDVRMGLGFCHVLRS